MPKIRRTKLTQAEMEKRLEEAPRRNSGVVTFACPNCDKELTRTVWGHAHEIDHDGNLTYDFYEAQAKCKCGARFLVAEVDYDGNFTMFWLNKKEMQQ